MRPSNKPARRAMMLVPLTLFVASCSPVLPRSSTPVSGPAIPALSQAARQPAIPSYCLPTCSGALTLERESWRNTLTPAASPDRPVSAVTTR
ncbi:hypothetical protein C7417_1962 [Cupriavidus plantarum]|nr:hypothetical protein C7417_1962 [Cupriavidus plantarum]